LKLLNQENTYTIAIISITIDELYL